MKKFFGIVFFFFFVLFILQIIYDILINFKISKINNCNNIDGQNLIKNLKKSSYLSIAYIIITIIVVIFHHIVFFNENISNIINIILLLLCIIGAILLIIIMIYNNYLSIQSRNYMLKTCFKDNTKLISYLLLSTIIRSLLICLWITLWFNSGIINVN